MRKRYAMIAAVSVIALCLISVLVYNLPPVHERLAWRVDNLLVDVKRFFNPPEEVVFTPQEQVEIIVNATLTAPTQPPLSPLVTVSPAPTLLPSLTPTAVPARAMLTGIRHEYQQFNNCAPANLSMVLSYWGWAGSQYETREYLRPN
jgi:hypothetical protein